MPSASSFARSRREDISLYTGKSYHPPQVPHLDIYATFTKHPSSCYRHIQRVHFDNSTTSAPTSDFSPNFSPRVLLNAITHTFTWLMQAVEELYYARTPTEGGNVVSTCSGARRKKHHGVVASVSSGYVLSFFDGCARTKTTPPIPTKQDNVRQECAFPMLTYYVGSRHVHSAR